MGNKIIAMVLCFVLVFTMPGSENFEGTAEGAVSRMEYGVERVISYVTHGLSSLEKYFVSTEKEEEEDNFSERAKEQQEKSLAEVKEEKGYDADVNKTEEEKARAKEAIQRVQEDGTVEDKLETKEQLRNYQKKKIRELNNKKGTYNKSSIVLADTTRAEAKRLAKKLGADLRITKDGTYAALELPKGVEIQDVYKNEKYCSELPEMEADYYVETAEAGSSVEGAIHDANGNEAAKDAHGRVLTAARPQKNVNDEYYSAQTYLDYTNLRDTWDITKGSDVTVAVIDTGIDTDHPEFTGKISSKSYYASEDKVVDDYGMEIIEDEQGHGTAVAGVIAAAMDNGQGVAGVAPDAELLIIKCDCDESGNFVRSSDLVMGLAYAVEAKADVVNMSFCTEENIFEKYTKLAADSDIVCVAAAGNDGSAMHVYPAADENVIGVGALIQDGWELAEYSNYGDNSDIVAPGTVYTTKISGEYGYVDGTSLASPLTAGAVALYLSQNPDKEFSTVFETVKASGVDIGPLGEDWKYGFGALDIYALVCEEKGTITYSMQTDELNDQTQIFVRNHTIQYMPEPERENMVSDGWFFGEEAEPEDECDYYNDIFTDDVTLYPKWINEDEGTAFVYSTLADGTLEIKSYTGRRRFVTIPVEIGGKKVTRIGEGAFEGNKRLQSLVLPEGLTTISDRAFIDCVRLKRISIPKSVKSIESEAFAGCVQLSEVNCEKSGKLQSIGEKAFSMCGLSEFTITDYVTELGDGVFFGSSGIKKYEVTDGNTAFSIVDDALMTADKSSILWYPAGLRGIYTLPAGITQIGKYAFSYSGCREILLGDDLISVGEYGFFCSKIRKMSVPQNVTTIGLRGFGSCRGLSEISFAEGSELKEISSYMFYGTEKLTDIVIPNQVTVIGTGAFVGGGLRRIEFQSDSHLETIENEVFNCCRLEQVQLPSSLKKVGRRAFAYCYKLVEVSFSEESACSSLGIEAFQGCMELKNITFPDGLKEVGERCFFNTSIRTVAIGRGLTSVGQGAFSSIKTLESITVDKGNETLSASEGVLFSKDGRVLMIYPCAKAGAYTIPENVERIDQYAFSGAEKLSEIVFDESLKEIGDNAFYHCESLVKPEFPAGLETIGGYAFSGCTAFTGTIQIPKNVISIGYYAFAEDFGLEAIDIEEESVLSRLGIGALAHTPIRSFTVPRNVKSMGQEVFDGCDQLITVTFEDGSQLEKLAAWTFDGARKLQQITFDEDSMLTEIEAHGLERLTSLNRITLSNCTQLKNIDAYAFQYCTALEQIVFPDSLERIGRYAFSGCGKLKKFEIPKGVSFIGRYAFGGTSSTIFFKDSVFPSGLQDEWNNGVVSYYLGVSEEITSGDFKYALLEDGGVCILGYNGSAESLSLDEIDGHPVVSIAGKAFENNTTLTEITLSASLRGIYNSAFKGTTALEKVTIPAEVSYIDDYAFEGSGIRSLTFEEGTKLEKIGKNAFARTNNLSSIEVPAAVTEIKDKTFYRSGIRTVSFAEGSLLTRIGKLAFSESDLTSIEIPDKVTEIGYNAFRGCTALEGVVLGDEEDLTIRDNAFYDTGLTSVQIPANVKVIGETCFADCAKLNTITVSEQNTAYSSEGGVLFDKNKTRLLACPAGKTGDFEMPETVTTIAFAAFEDCSLSRIDIPEKTGLITLGYRTFYGCKNLQSIQIPEQVTSIDNYAFANCENLETVEIPADSKINGIFAGAFANCEKLTSVIVPQGVMEISDRAFYGCKGLTQITLLGESALEVIGDHAFEGTGITELMMPDHVLEIGDYAFNKSKLSRLVLNDKLISVGMYAFAECGLEETSELVFPASVKYLGTGVLQGNLAVEKLTLPYFAGIQGLPYSPLASLYGGADPRETAIKLSEVTVLDGDEVPDNYFFAFNRIKKVNLPDTVTSLGNGCLVQTSIEELDLSKVEYIGNEACGIESLKKIILSDRLKRIGDSAFSNTSLTEIELPESVESIGKKAFSKTDITGVIQIGKKVTEIGGGAFSGNPKLEEISVDEANDSYCSVDGILYNKKKTEIVTVPGGITGTVVLPEELTKIDDQAFYLCKKLEEVVIPDSVSSIGEWAFEDCSSLKNIEIPDSVIEAGNQTFAGCSSLKAVVLGNGVKQLPYGMFISCTNLESISLPNGLETIGDDFDIIQLKLVQTA